MVKRKTKPELQSIIGKSKIIKYRTVKEKNKEGKVFFTYYIVAGDEISGYYIYTIINNRILRIRGTKTSGGKNKFKTIPKL